MPQKEPPFTDWQRIYALPYNHYFKEKVVEARLSLGLPPDGISDKAQAGEWLHNHLGLKKPFLPNVSTIPLWVALFSSPSEHKPLETSVPLFQWALILAHEFKLPLNIYKYISRYIINNDERLLINWKGLNTNITFDTKDVSLKITVTVDGIHTLTTKNEWDAIWYDDIKPMVGLLESAGQPSPKGKKPGRGKRLQELIQRWAEWYELSERSKPPLGPTKALAEWEKQHPNEIGRYDLSTVTKDVRKFIRLITLVSS